MRLLVTRPESEAHATAKMLRSAGHEVLVEPMLIVQPVRDVALPLDGVDALIVTSANALRALEHHPEIDRLMALPLFAVGTATGELATRMGFRSVTAGPGTVGELMAVIQGAVAPKRTLLHLAGDVLAADLETPLVRTGLALRSAVVYRTTEQNRLSAAAEAALRSGGVDGVILMSPRTARVFAALCRAAGLTLDGVAHYCLSEACAQSLGPDARNIRIAATPELSALLKLIAEDTAQLPGRS